MVALHPRSKDSGPFVMQNVFCPSPKDLKVLMSSTLFKRPTSKSSLRLKANFTVNTCKVKKKPVAYNGK
jgi:hypothetical protein